MGEVTWFRVRRMKNDKTEHHTHRNHSNRVKQPWLLDSLVRRNRLCVAAPATIDMPWIGS